jgi:hypothetical protein
LIERKYMASAELLQNFLDLDDEVKSTDDRLAELKRSRSSAEKLLLEELLKEGLSSLKVDRPNGRKLVYLHNTVGVSAKDKDRLAVIDALRKLGMDEYVKEEPSFVTQSLGAWVRAQQNAELPIPPELEAVLKIEQLCSVRVRQA